MKPSSLGYLEEMLQDGNISETDFNNLKRLVLNDVLLPRICDTAVSDECLGVIPGNIVIGSTTTRSQLEACSKVFNIPEIFQTILAELPDVYLIKVAPLGGLQRVPRCH